MEADRSAAAVRVMRTPVESACSFAAGKENLIGIVHHPPGVVRRRGVVVVVGGPQYRVGSHRQFVLLGRHLATAGVPVLRFDYRGMGDASGEMPGFEAINQDIAAAVDQLFKQVPELEEVALWGLCDAASAALFYAWRDARVTGVVLLNPWVRTEEGEARTRLKHYYGGRLVSGAFWRKVLSGRWNPAATVRSLVGYGRQLMAGRQRPADDMNELSLPERMAEGLARFQGEVLLILSGDDLTAAEFRETAARSERWRGLLADERVTRFELPEANHTFSRQEWRDAVARQTLEWVRSF